MPGPLGRGVWEVWLRERGGVTAVTQLPFTSLTCGRRLDDVSTASVSLVPPLHLYALLGGLQPWEVELSLERDGVVAWAGPVLNVKHTQDHVELQARDLFYWLDRRRLETPFDITADLASIFEFAVSVAMARDPSPNITVRPEATGITGRRTNDATGIQRAGDLLRELARTAVDFTTVGRTIFVGGATITGPATGAVVLVQEAFGADLVIDRGNDATISEATVYGENTGLVATAGGVHPQIGLVQTVEQESTIRDDASLLAAVEGRLALAERDLKTVSGTLTPAAAASLPDLVPGIEVDARATAMASTVDETMRLADVGISADAGGEKITVKLQPLGAEGE